VPTVKEILNAFGLESVEIIRSNMQRAGQNATGETSASIRSEMITDERVQVSGPDYVYVLEKGRGPRKSSERSDFSDKLERWIVKRGVHLSMNKTVAQATRSLQYLINKRGTKLFRQGGRTDIITPIFAESRFKKLTADITKEQFNKTIKSIENGISNV
jgi:hypothetical protein